MEVLFVICRLVRMSVFSYRKELLSVSGRGSGFFSNRRFRRMAPSDIDWNKVFADAGFHGISSICYQTVKTLPLNCRPDDELLRRWEQSAGDVHETFQRAEDGSVACFQFHQRVVSLIESSITPCDNQTGLDPVMEAVHDVDRAAMKLYCSGGRATLDILLDLVLLLKKYPYVIMYWDGCLENVGLDRVARVLLCVSDELFRTGFRKNWDSHTRLSAHLFIRLFILDSNRIVRYFGKFLYLPLTASEMFSLWYGKASALYTSLTSRFRKEQVKV